MNITSIKMAKTKGVTDVKALASIIIDNSICINDIKIVEKRGFPCVCMPTKRDHAGFVEVVHPIKKEARQELIEVLLKEYKNIGR